MIEKDFDIPFVARMALREKQIQQNYRPIIAVHKWFARRPGTLFRALILSEFAAAPLRDRYFTATVLKGVRIADPFMGGGTPLLEANRLGCDVVGYDINPMAYWIVNQEIGHLNLKTYREMAVTLTQWLEGKVGRFYQTRCLECGALDASAKYFLWVKTHACQQCGMRFDLFPGYLLSENRRHPQNVFVCPDCGELTEVSDRKNPGKCHSCSARLVLSGPAKRNHCKCPHCGTSNGYPNPKAGPPMHRMYAIEYHCRRCKVRHEGRFFKKPDKEDLSKLAEVETLWGKVKPAFVPNDQIPSGDETDRLHRWGYLKYREMFNPRQLLGLEMSCCWIGKVADTRIRNALATNLSDLLRYQNMLCRYDTMALKSLDIFSVHGFPVGLVQCESNFLGIAGGSEGVVIGSGGWANIIEKYVRAKNYCTEPFEVAFREGREVRVFIPGEWIGDQRNGEGPPETRSVTLHCESATKACVPPASLDAVFTDPPYFGNVQYAELMDFCYVWLRRLVGDIGAAFTFPSTRNADELTGNVTMDRGLGHFTQGLSEVFSRMAEALKPGSPLVFTYHHNTLEAYYPVAVAILDAKLTCSASLPCPAEMGASIHINGTGSSVLDTVFVCRSRGKAPARWIVKTPEGFANLVRGDIEQLRAGEVTPTRGDLRCLIFGHLVRMAIWELRKSWGRDKPVEHRLGAVEEQAKRFGGLEAVERVLGEDFLEAPKVQRASAREAEAIYEVGHDEVLF